MELTDFCNIYLTFSTLVINFLIYDFLFSFGINMT